MSELVSRREHLAVHRRMVIGRALATAAAGSLPVPLVEEWLASRIQRGTIRRLADRRGVDLDDLAIRAIADGPSAPPDWLDLAGGTLAYRMLSRSFRRLVLVYVLSRRARAATRAFLIATLFDHYCARLHVGLGVGGEAGTALRGAMERALADTPGSLGQKAFRRGGLSAARAALRAPFELADAASGGALTRALRQRDEVEAVAELDDAIDRELAESRSVLARTAAALEIQLAPEQNPYVSALVDRFEALWREREPGR